MQWRLTLGACCFVLACAADDMQLPAATPLAAQMSAGAAASAMAPSATEICIADNPPSQPFDIGDYPAPASRPGGPPPVLPSVETVSQQCSASGGSGCAADGFISKQAAICIARHEGLQPGLTPWQVTLTYHSGYMRVIWNLMNVLEMSERDGLAGRIMSLDAVDGHVAGGGGYRAIP